MARIGWKYDRISLSFSYIWVEKEVKSNKNILKVYIYLEYPTSAGWKYKNYFQRKYNKIVEIILYLFSFLYFSKDNVLGWCKNNGSFWYSVKTGHYLTLFITLISHFCQWTTNKSRN